MFEPLALGSQAGLNLVLSIGDPSPPTMYVDTDVIHMTKWTRPSLLFLHTAGAQNLDGVGRPGNDTRPNTCILLQSVLELIISVLPSPSKFSEDTSLWNLSNTDTLGM